MNILLIENQPLADMIRSKRTDIDVYGGLGQPVEVVAADIKSRLAERYDVIIIGVHAQIGNALLSDHAGIQLLKLLRLHHIDKHVVFYSWMSREMLMGNLRNAIVFSKGVTFYRLPNFINEVQDLDFDKLSHETADKNELLPLFRAEYNPDDRHFDANMFGVWQLVKMQEVYEKLGGLDTSIDDDFKSIAQSMGTYQALLVNYINGIKYNISYEQFLNELYFRNKLMSENIKRLYPQRMKYIHSNIESIKAKLCDEPSQFKDKETEGKTERLANLLARYTEEERRLSEHLDRCGDKNILKSNVMLCYEPDDEGCFDFRELLRKASPRIVYVDDMAEQGWSHILQRIIYGEVSTDFQTIIPFEGESSKEIADRIWEASKSTRFHKAADLIILDIRLRNERGYVKPSKLSGFEVMSLLGLKTPCPILMFTASNKIWSLKKAFKGNAVSFWIKGGVDNGVEDIADSYFDLIKQTWSLVSTRWIFETIAELRRIANVIQVANNPFWWQTYETGFKYDAEANVQMEKNDRISYFNRRLTPKEVVVNLLYKTAANTLYDLRQLYFLTTPLDVSNLCCRMIIQLSYILDEIHRSKEVTASTMELFSLQYRMLKQLPDQSRQQKIIKDLCAVRNRATHRGSDEVFDKYTVVAFVKQLKEYLINDMTVDDMLIETEDCCPIDEREGTLSNGQTIKVTIVKIIPARNGVYLRFVIGPNTEQNRTASVFVDQRICSYYKLGDVISIKRMINQTTGVFMYVIVPQITPVGDRQSKLDNGEVVFVEIEELKDQIGQMQFGFSTKKDSDPETIMYAIIDKKNSIYDKMYKYATVGDIIFVRKHGAAGHIRPFGFCPQS